MIDQQLYGSLTDNGTAVTISVVCGTGVALVLAVSQILRFRRIFQPTASSVTFDPTAVTILHDTARKGLLRILACETSIHEDAEDPRQQHPVADADLDEHSDGIFLEVIPSGRAASGRMGRAAGLHVMGLRSHGHPILRVDGAATAQTIAAVLLEIRNLTGRIPRVDFLWPEASYAWQQLRFACLGTGQTAATTREILRRAEPDAARRPIVHIG